MSAPATLPPEGLPGLDPAWSRLVTAPDADGVTRSWHVLDTHAHRGVNAVALTVLCVHGNPTWSYLWRRVVGQAPEGVRVVAVDQLDMGFSERTGTDRTLAMRVADLGALTAELGLGPQDPVVVIAHDWGGPIALGWALDHRSQVQGIALLNTAVHQPAGSAAPGVIRIARSGPIRRSATVRTPAFVRGTTALHRRSIDAQVARAYAAPYSTAERRQAIGQFVADIPLEPDHPSAGTLAAIAEGIRSLDMPAILLWGPRDPVFADRYLHDLEERLPQAQVHRYADAGHLVIEDAPQLVRDLWTWISTLRASDSGGDAADAGRATVLHDSARPMWEGLSERAEQDPHAVALAELVGSQWRTVSWDRLDRNVRDLAAGLHAEGVRAGDRVSVLIPVGADLVATIYACWRIGASVVVTDAGLGARGIARALSSAAPDHIIAIPRGMGLVRALRISGNRIPARDLARIARHGAGRVAPPAPGPDDEALVAFTSGSTGPAKGVVYAHRQLQRTRDLLHTHYAFTGDDALVAAFAPWAVLGPALGLPSAIPDMDVTSPRTLTAVAVADAARQVGGTVMWASPAALGSILRTAGALTDPDLRALQGLRLILGAGAPVDRSILHGMQRLVPTAQVRTPYGMTEVLPVCDVTIDDIDAAGPGPGVLVGDPLAGVEVRIAPVDARGVAAETLVSTPGVLGEVAVRASHRKVRYDRLWSTEQASSRNVGWHRTGDLGTLDDVGRLWIGGRLAHVITTEDGPVAPVPVEQVVQGLREVEHAACVGVGPVGIQQVVVICVTHPRNIGPAPLELIDEVRRVSPVPVTAVLLRSCLPVDIRHNSKIDRAWLANWASDVLAGDA